MSEHEGIQGHAHQVRKTALVFAICAVHESGRQISGHTRRIVPETQCPDLGMVKALEAQVIKETMEVPDTAAVTATMVTFYPVMTYEQVKE